MTTSLPPSVLVTGQPAALERRAGLEIGAVLLTGAGHLAFRAADAGIVFIPLASVAWGGYVAHRVQEEPGYLGDLGFRSRGLGPTFLESSIVAAAAVSAMAGIAASQGTLDFDADLLPLFVLYPAWGLVQQGLVQGMVARNLDRGDAWWSSPYAVVPVAALLFGAVHLPNAELTAATTALGAAHTAIYLRHGNIWPLGIYHGILGALFYFWVLDENPWRDLIG